MDKSHYEELYKSSVSLTEGEEQCCDKCCDPVIFHLRDNYHEFTMALSTVIECIVFAIQNGDLPKLPLSWLEDVDYACGTAFSEDERNYYPDDNFPRKGSI